MPNKKLVRKEERVHRDEMNLLEFPIGLVSDRVPIDPATGKEVTEIRFHRKIFDGAVTREQEWIVRGDPAFGGLPRGYDLDIFTAIMSEWSKTSFQHRLVSLGSTYRLLLSTGKRDRPEDYQRVELGVRRWFGVSIETRHAVYDPAHRTRAEEFIIRFFSSLLRTKASGDVPKGCVRVTDELYSLVQKGYLKLTDTERYWRLPTPYSRRLFQYLDKHRGRALRELDGRFEIDGYLLAKKLGTLDQTLQKYRPAKLHDVMSPHLEALEKDGYLAGWRWKREGKGRAAIVLEVTYRPDAAPQAPPSELSPEEAAVVELIGRELGEPDYRPYHATLVRELGPGMMRSILTDVIVQAERNPRTHKGKLFSHLVGKRRKHGHRSSPHRGMRAAS
jgi:hypothetical protein